MLQVFMSGQNEDHTNPYDLVLNKIVQNVLRSLGDYPVNLEKTLLVC